MKKILSQNSAQTKKIAVRLAHNLLKSGRSKSKAAIIALYGDLGAGKTTFVQGFAKGLGLSSRIVSPTFLIIRNYKLKVKRYKRLYHVDVYRLHSVKELESLGFKKIISDPQNIVLIEWADKIKKILPPDTIWIHLEHGQNEKRRVIRIYN